MMNWFKQYGLKVALRAFVVSSMISGVALGSVNAHASEPLPIPTQCANVEPFDWVYTMDAAEQALASVDLESNATTFSLLASFEGTSIIIKVKDTATGRSVGVIKTDTSNTSTVGEIYAYRLARVLGFSEIVAPTIPVTLHDGALRKVRDLLTSLRYRDANKESNRVKVLRLVETALAEGGTFTGAFKVWVPSFMFHAGLGTRTSVSRMEIMRHVGARTPQPEDRQITLSQTTRLYEPVGTYRGQVNLAQLAQDYSNMLLMDALMGQRDRFAGANVHFRSLTDEKRENGTRQGMPVFEMGTVRLLALDNGASMASRNGEGIRDLQGSIDPATRIERFSRFAIERTRALDRRMNGTGCSAPPSDAEIAAMFAFFGVKTPATIAFARSYFPRVIEYIDQLTRAHGDRIYFNTPASQGTAPTQLP